ncbi:cilia- and flagella-associated protein 47-like isoform X3 [Gouania willdenowi]|uniref:cilia- and flagella-associated protein 47-like isoform X3 n=1 Tax=Gouania willdenowi TaxID=441366 RepID=UPI001055A5E9|nr:cilia- and flagella-associated protein 47 isoform X3 [Gouania willdenowi]
MAGASVRVEPPFVEFIDVSVGQVYRVTVTAHNVGKTSRKIRMGKPVSKLFKFTASGPAVGVAPGLSVSGVLEFTPQEESEVRDCLVIHVDDVDKLKIPLLGIPRTCSLLIDPILDFGCIVASGQIITKDHPITNEGSASGAFQVQFSGASSLSLSPLSGVIAAGSTQWLKVELCADRLCLIDEKAEVKLQNRPPVVLSIRAEMVDQYLEVFDLQGTPLSSVWFGPLYFGTSCVKEVVLKNSSPQSCDWVCLLQDAAGTEVGTDLQKSTNATLLQRMKRCDAATFETSQVLACFPKQGRLRPYGTVRVAVRFSPVCKSRASRQDYCLFLLFECVGSKNGFNRQHAKSSAEMAVSGSGLPVSLVLQPSERFHFPSCKIGQHTDHVCVLKNLCSQLPVSFSFRKLAHFIIEPSTGTIDPGQCQDVILSFKARQLGNFQMCLKLDILGYVISAEDLTKLKLSNFHTVTLHLSAVCESGTTQPGGQMFGYKRMASHVRLSDLAHCRGISRAAVLSADKTMLHRHQRAKISNAEDEEEFLAFPNDRALSIRPSSPHRQYRTIFTGVNRYCYVDIDYAFTEDEKKQRKSHQQIYADFMKQLGHTRRQRLNKRREEKDDDVNIGLVPAHGLVPPKLSLLDLKSSGIDETKPKLLHGVHDNQHNIPPMTISNSQQSLQTPELVKAVPSTCQEMADCSRTLTPQELYRVVIGPSDVDFGDVCVQSLCVRNLLVMNPLSVHVWVQLDVDLPELQGSSPLSHVLPPHSQSTLCLTFQSNKLGPFCRSFSYSINNKQHRGQILVQAQVVPLTLKLSTDLLVLWPTPGLLAASGYRSFVTLSNQFNHPAEFTWQPVLTERGILFSVRPATGVVEPYRELDCEVVWHPSFSAPSEGDFDLCVNEGNKQRLHCVAKVRATRVQLAEKHIVFRSVPLNMPSVRTAVLHNTGQNHAYYQVLDVCPVPGMVVSPSEGTVPSRGQASLQIIYNPDCVVKFDARIEIALRNMKSIELRVGGSVEPPNIDISVSRFQFHGVYIGSQRVIPFTLTNQSSAPAQVTFDLSEHENFTLRLPHPATAERRAALSVVEIREYQTMELSLVFSPTEITSFNFDLPLIVNGVKYLSTTQSLLPASSSSSTSSSPAAGSRKHTAKSVSYSVTTVAHKTPSVQATVLCAPLEMSPSHLQFSVDPQYDTYTKNVDLKAAHEESVCWKLITGDHISWWFDIHTQASPTQDGRKQMTWTASPSSGILRPGQSITVSVTVKTASEDATQLIIPLYVGEEIGEKQDHLYRELSINMALQHPSITIHPPHILLTPVPLNTSIKASLVLMAAGYSRGTSVSAEVDEVEMTDGTKINPVFVVFPQGNTIPAQDQEEKPSDTSLLCNVTFCLDVPMSLWTTITFTDHLNNRFKAKLCAITDNCLLSVWPYMALHYSEQQIVLEKGLTDVGALLLRCHTPFHASASATSSSVFEMKSSTNSTSGSTDSESEKVSTDAEDTNNRLLPNVLGYPQFPAANTEEGRYHQSVLVSMERWFSLFGWPGGPHLITIPHTLRKVNGLNKNARSVVDMLHHLTGIQIPGIARCQNFSADLDRRTNELLQQHEAMLTFLSVQGALLCHIRPEYLLDVLEFEHWRSLQSKDAKHALDYDCLDYESLSKRSWTDVLLQIYKVLVLCRVSETSTNPTLDHKDSDGNLPITSQPLTSNIYSLQELQLLSWLNVHYQSMRKTVWEAVILCWSTGGVPAARWIVNFDLDLTDGLVLAALLAAYCPYLIESHFQRMYTTASSLEKILHNNIIVTQALTALGLNINIQPTDLSDPNPVQILILCAHLYERLPQYLPIDSISLSGGLHSTLSKKVRLKNPSSKPVGYHALIFGVDAHLFSLPDGATVKITPKSTSEVTVNFRCSFLQPKEATLLLISSLAFVHRCATLAFNLKTDVNHIKPTKTLKCKSPCYQLQTIQLPISNTFNEEATFRVVLVESTSNPLEPDSIVQQAKTEIIPSDNICADKEDCEFLSKLRTVCLGPGQADTLGINYMPFYPGTKYCSVLLVCPQVGDMVYMIKATSELPLPSPLSANPSTIEFPAKNSNRAICLQCQLGQVCEEVFRVPGVNLQWEEALAVWGQQRMSAEEHGRRMLTRTLHSSSVRATTAWQKLRRQMLLEGVAFKKVEYDVEVSLPQYFTLPSTVTIPIQNNAHALTESSAVDVPLRFQANTLGTFECKVVLSSWFDTRVYLLEARVIPQTMSTN